MNLIQIQDRLKELPNSPQTMQLLMGYANGQSPVVPPYLALGELQRRNKIMQEQASAQPPQGTVKDQIQQQASGIASLSQQGQAMAQQQMQPPQQATPQPQQTPQPPAQTVQAAGGGLMSLLARAQQAKRMNSGGIVAFRRAGPVGDPVEYDDDAEAENVRAAIADAEDDDEEGAGGINMPTDSRSLLAFLNAMAVKQRMQTPPASENPIELEERLKKQYPERFATLGQPVGVAALQRLDELQAAQREELAKRREEAAAAKPSVLQLLGQAALGTRGQFGKSAIGALLGGYGQIQSAADAKALEQEQALRMRELELQQVRAEAMNKIDDIRRAKEEGDVKRVAEHEKEVARLMKDYNVSNNSTLGKQITAAAAVAAADTRAGATIESAKIRAAATKEAANKPKAPTSAQMEQQRIQLIKQNIINRAKAEGRTVSPAEAEEQAIMQYRMGTPSAAGVYGRIGDAADRALENVRYLPTFRKEYLSKYPSAAEAEAAFREDFINNRVPPALKAGLGVGSAAPAPAPAAAAPAAQFKVGETRVVQQGPNKGKTAEWDGTGWKLK